MDQFIYKIGQIFRSWIPEWKHRVVFSVCLAMLSACTGLKYTTEEDPLYTGYEMKIQSDSRISNDLKYELNNVNRPKPNGKFLWMRPGLAIYNMMGQPKKEKGIRYWVKNKIGRPPVKPADVSPENIVGLMNNRLFNRGYFNARISHEWVISGKKVEASYEIQTNDQYTLDSINYLSGKTGLEQQIKASESTSLLTPGAPYWLEDLKSERQRIEYLLRDSGYYYFDKDFLIFNADTTGRDAKVDLLLKSKPDMPKMVYNRIYLNKVYILDDITSENYQPDTMQYRGFTYVSNRHVFRPDIITDHVHLYRGDLYSRSMQIRTVNQLSDLGVYRFVNVEFTEDTSANRLNAYIYARPYKKSALTAELNGVIKTTNYLGPGVKISWRHRNAFGGGEELSLNLLGSFEVQVGADSINTALEAGVEVGLKIPRPLVIKKLGRNTDYVPFTNIVGGFSAYRRVELYTMGSFFTTFGYSWRKSPKVSHIFNPVDFSFTSVTNQTDAFREYLENNPTVRRSFEEQYIIGSHYAFLYDNLQDPSKKSTFYFRGGIDVAGNLTYAFYSSFSDKEPTNDDPYEILGVPFSQYVMFNPELRYYLKSGRQNVLATRLIMGFGLPYGNSRVMPYVKQFFSGGTNSVRGFLARTLGPGSYQAPVENLGVDQTGDIRLEFNAEYRFHFSKLLMGAAFVDIGNVWLRNTDPDRPGGDFQLNRFYKELGISTGFGLRFDLQVLVFRLDLGWPLYVPYLSEGERWVVGDIDFFSKDWRKQNLIWNVAIGYPF